MPVEITVNQNQLRDIDILLSGVKGGSDRAMFTAVQRTTRTARTRLSRLIRSELNLKKRDVDRLVFVRFPATHQRPTSGIRISGKLLPLKRFGAKQLKRQGVVATTFKGKGRQRFAHSFIVDSLGGHAFSRQAQKANAQFGAVSGRLPIFRLLGPSAADAAVARQGELDAELQDLGTVLESNLLSQVDRLLQRRRVDR